MPRAIIDTESSRPAYVRRNVIMIVAAVILAMVIVYLYQRQLHQNTPGHGHSTQTTTSGQSANRPATPPGK